MTTESKWTVDQLMVLGQLAGYSKAETARLILAADDAKRRTP